MIPHVTSHEDADITELEEFRGRLNKEIEKSGVRVEHARLHDQGGRGGAEEISGIQFLARGRESRS